MKTFAGKFVNEYVGESSKMYSFKTEMEIEPGDLVVVDCSAGLGVVIVDEVHASPVKHATRWAFQKVDISALNALNDRDARIANIKAKLDEKLRNRKEADKYRELAAQDNEARGLLAELEVLNGNLPT